MIDISAVAGLTAREMGVLRLLAEAPADIPRMVASRLGTEGSLRVHLTRIRKQLAASPLEIVASTVYELRRRRESP